MEYAKTRFRQRKGYFDVVIYYSNTSVKPGEKKELIIRTGIKVKPNNLTSKTKIASTHPNLYEDLITINDRKQRIETIILEYVKKYKSKPTCEFVEEEFNKPYDIALKTREYILDYFDDYITFIKKKQSSKGSLRPHLNLKDPLTQFQKKQKKDFRFSDIDETFINNFIEFLLYEKIDERRVKKDHKGLNNNTLIKRISHFKRFLKYVITYQDISINIIKIEDFIDSSKKRLDLKGFKPTKYALTNDELIHYYNFTPSQFQREKDTFLFMLLQGLRISDTISLTDLDIENNKICKDAIKTNEEFQVDLHPISKIIWNKWDNNFDMWEQDLNDRLKIIFKEFFLWYKEIYDKKNDDPYELQIIKRIKKGLSTEKEKLYKWELITSHTARHTFISILATKSELSLQELQKFVGQKDIKTTLGYMQSIRTISIDQLLPLKKLNITE